MRTYRLFLMAVMTCLYTGVSGQQLDWCRIITGDSITQLSGYSTSVDPSGNYVYLSGDFFGTGNFDPGASNYTLTETNPVFYVLKRTTAGGFVWARRFTCFGTAQSTIVRADASGNCYLFGYFYGLLDADPGPGNVPLVSANGYTDMFLIKLDPAGNLVWSQKFGSTGADYPGAIFVTGSSIYCAGMFNGTIDFDNGPGTQTLSSPDYGDVFAMKLDTAGQLDWAVGMGATTNTEPESEGASDIIVSASGEVYVTGSFAIAGDFDPGAGTTILTPLGPRDHFIVKLDTDANFQWAIRTGNQQAEYNNHLAIGPDGSLYEGGTFRNATTGTLVDMDIGIARYTNQGAELWAHRFGGGWLDQVINLEVDEAGSVYICGTIESTGIDFDPGPGTVLSDNYYATFNGYLLKLTANGELGWFRCFSNPDPNAISGLDYDNAGTLYISGTVVGSMDVDFSPATHIVSSAGLFPTVFLLKLDTTSADVVTGTEELSTTPFRLYPNPTDGNTTLQLQSAGTGNSVTIYNLQGEIVRRQELQQTSTQIDLEALLSGIYLVEVQQNGIKSRQYIIRQ